MNTAPKIGDRVIFKDTDWEYGGWRSEGITGTVTRIYKHYDDVFDDDGEFVRPGPLLPPSEWKVAMKVDCIPKGWAYGDCDEFAPDVKCLTKCRGAK